MSDEAKGVEDKQGETQAFRVRLPGFVSEKEVGLGEAITRGTSRLGIRPCGGCRRRAAALDRWVAFTGRPR